MNQQQAFEKWWKQEYSGGYGKDQSKDAFLAGLQHQEMNQINCLYEIRKAVGDPEGKLMQDDLVERVKELMAALKEMEAMYTHAWDRVDGGLTMRKSSVERFDSACGRAYELLKSVTTEKEEA
jgi:hypothetical protein